MKRGKTKTDGCIRQFPCYITVQYKHQQTLMRKYLIYNAVDFKREDKMLELTKTCTANSTNNESHNKEQRIMSLSQKSIIFDVVKKEKVKQYFLKQSYSHNLHFKKSMKVSREWR